MSSRGWCIVMLLLAGCMGAPPEGVPSEIGSVSEIVASSQKVAELAERGRVLFRIKGCVTCHINERVEGASGLLGSIGPNLTHYSNDPEFLQRWLTDPRAVRSDTVMPNLRLSVEEIESLIAFLNQSLDDGIHQQ